MPVNVPAASESARLFRRRLASLHPLGTEELALLDGLPTSGLTHRAGTEIDTAGAAIAGPRGILSGWACLHRVLPDGRQQIVRILLPGDMTGLHPHRAAPLALSSMAALVPVETVNLEPLAAAWRSERPDYAGLRAAMAAALALEQAHDFAQIVRLGRQTAQERVVSLLLELRDRLLVVGLGARGRFPLPLTQEVLANTLGLSAVHLNRTLQQLRRDGLIVLGAGEAELLDVPRLAELADYETVRVSSASPPGRPRP